MKKILFQRLCKTAKHPRCLNVTFTAEINNKLECEAMILGLFEYFIVYDFHFNYYRFVFDHKKKKLFSSIFFNAKIHLAVHNFINRTFINQYDKKKNTSLFFMFFICYYLKTT